MFQIICQEIVLLVAPEREARPKEVALGAMAALHCGQGAASLLTGRLHGGLCCATCLGATKSHQRPWRD